MDIKEVALILKLSYLREFGEDFIEEAENLGLTNREFIELYLEREVEKRRITG